MSNGVSTNLANRFMSKQPNDLVSRMLVWIKNYDYKERKVELDTSRQFRLGEGKISGYCSVLLGSLSLLGVLAYLYPSY